MQSIPFLTVNQQTISLSQALDYLRHAGSFPKLIDDIVRQYVLGQELQFKENLKIDHFKVDQAIMEFRLNNKLLDETGFQKWLMSNNLTYEEFQRPFIFSLKVDALKKELTEPGMEAFFQKKKSSYDRVVISRIIVKDKNMAENLKQKLLINPKQFEELAKQDSIAHDRVTNGMMGLILCGTLPTVLKSAIQRASVGEIIGPLEIEGCYGLFRVEEFLEASLEDRELKQELQNQLFEQWLQEKLQTLEIKLEVK